MADTMNSLNKELDTILKPLFENKIFVAGLGLFLALYAGWLAPALPDGVIGFFDTAVGKLLFIFLIAFVASRDVPNSLQVALIVSVIFLITLTVLNNLKMKEAFRNLGVEHFGLMSQMRDLMSNNNVMEHIDTNNPDEKDAPNKGDASQAPPAAKAAKAPEAAQAAEPKPMSCDDVLNKCYTDFTPEQQTQVCGGLFEEPKDTALELPKENDFKQMNCGGYIKQCMAEPNNVSNKKFLNMKATGCPVPANQ
jgi:hypothetical protein